MSDTILELEAPAAGATTSAAKTPSRAAQSESWIISGYRHVIPLGLDHLLFIFGLFLLAPRWKPLLGQSLLFTVAHSITLALAIFGIISLPSILIEILIAASIAWIGIENLLMKELKPSRLFLVFGFGLLHGMGFASVLREKLGDLSGKQIALPLVSFNVGVELAQITVLACAFLLLWPLRKWTRNIPNGGLRSRRHGRTVLDGRADFIGLLNFEKLCGKFEDAGLTGVGRLALLSSLAIKTTAHERKRKQNPFQADFERSFEKGNRPRDPESRRRTARRAFRNASRHTSAIGTTSQTAYRDFPCEAALPPAAPASPPKPPTATVPAASGAPTAPKAPAPAPTIPLRTAGGATKPPAAGAPTIKLATSNAPVGAPTIALKTANAPLPGGAPTVGLPKATVALNPPTKPLSPTSAAATQKPTLSVQEDGEDESGADTFDKILAGVGLVAALIVLGLQLKVANIWIGAEDADSPGDWSQLLE